MNESKKLSLSKETLRSLDDQDLTDVVGGSGEHHRRNGGGNNQSFALVCISNNGCNVSNGGVCSGICI